MKRKSGRLGFSLVELLVVIAIIGIIAAIVIPSVMAYMNYGAKNSALSEAAAVKADLEAWYDDHTKTSENVERGKNLIFDFVDAEIEKEETYASKLTYAYIPSNAINLSYDDEDSKFQGTKYYAQTSKEAFDLSKHALIIYNNGKKSCAIVLPLNDNYYFTGTAFVYANVYDSDDALLKKYCKITDGINAVNNYVSEGSQVGKLLDLANRDVTIKFLDRKGIRLGNEVTLKSGQKVDPSTIPEYGNANIKVTKYDGYTFNGKWLCSQNNVVYEAKNLSNITINRDTTFTAQYDSKNFKIRFNSEYIDNANNLDYRNEDYKEVTGQEDWNYQNNATVVELQYGDTLSIAAPNKTGYTFGGWMKDTNSNSDALTEMGDINYEFTEVYFPKFEDYFKSSNEEVEIDLYAKWVKKTLTVTLMGYNSGQAAIITVPYDGTLKDGTIKGESSRLSDDVYNKYFANQFMTNFTVSEGTVNIPESHAYKSWSWYTGSTTSSKFDIDNKIRTNITLYARPNFDFYLVSDEYGNNLLNTLQQTGSTLYFKIANSVVKGNERFAIQFYNSETSYAWSNLEFIYSDSSYHYYSVARTASSKQYQHFKVAKFNSATSNITTDAWCYTPELTYTTNNVYVINGSQSQWNNSTNSMAVSLTVENVNGSDINYTSCNRTLIEVSKVTNYSSYDWYVCYLDNSGNYVSSKKLENFSQEIDSIYVVDLREDYTKYKILYVQSGTQVTSLKGNSISNELANSDTQGKIYFVTNDTGSVLTIKNEQTSDYQFTIDYSLLAATITKQSDKGYDMFVVGQDNSGKNYKYGISYTDGNKNTITIKLAIEYQKIQICFVKRSDYGKNLNASTITADQLLEKKYVVKLDAFIDASSDKVSNSTIKLSNTIENKRVKIESITGGSSISSVSSDYKFSSGNGLLSLDPSTGSINYSDGKLSCIVSVPPSGTSFKILYFNEGRVDYLGFDALNKADQEKATYAEGTKSQGTSSILIQKGDTYEISIKFSSSENFGAPTIYIESTQVAVVNYYRANGNGSSDLIASELVKYNEYASYCESLNSNGGLDYDGYHFSGKWYTDLACTEEFSSSTQIESSLNIFAKMDPNTYTIQFDNKGIGDVISDQQFVFGSDITLPVAVDSTNVYRFDGWYLDEEFTLPVNTINSDVVSGIDNGGTIKLYAKWTSAVYYCYYFLNGGWETTGNENKQSFIATDEDFTLKDPVRTGFEFKGWYDNEAFNGAPITTIDCSEGQDRYLYAKWGVKDPNAIYLVLNNDTDNQINLYSQGQEYVTSYTLDIAETNTFDVVVDSDLDADELSVSYLWYNEDYETTKDDSDVISYDSSFTIEEEGEYVYFLKVSISDRNGKVPANEFVYKVSFNIYNSSIENKTVSWTGTSHKQDMDLDPTYVSQLDEEPVITIEMLQEDETYISTVDAINVGKYKFTYTLKINGETITKVAYLEIVKATIYIRNNTVFTADGNVKTVSIPVSYVMSDDPDYETKKLEKVLTIEGTISASETNEEGYTFYATINDNARQNYDWADGSDSTITKQFTWKILGQQISTPVFANDENVLQYNGKEQTFDIYSYIPSDAKYVVVDDGDTQLSATNVGTYTVKLSILDEYKNDYFWSDGLQGTTDDQIITWEIVKATPTLAEEPTIAPITVGDDSIMVAGESNGITGGKMVYPGTTDEISGTFTWKTTRAPQYSGTFSYVIIFTPDDLDNVAVTSISVKVTVSKIDLSIDNITTMPTAGIYYSSYDTIDEVELTGGKVTLVDGKEVNGTFTWKNIVKYPNPNPGNEEGTIKDVEVLFTPTNSSAYSTLVFKMDVDYIENSYSVTFSGENSHISSYTVDVDGTAYLVNKGTDLPLEVIKPKYSSSSTSNQISITINKIDSFSTFTGIIFDKGTSVDNVNLSTYTIASAGKLIIKTVVNQVVTVSLSDGEGYTVAAKATVEDYEAYVTGNPTKYKEISQETFGKEYQVPTGALIQLTYTIDKGYKLEIANAIDETLGINLMDAAVPEGGVKDTHICTFTTKASNVDVNGQASEETTNVEVSCNAAGYGKVSIYKNDELIGTISSTYELDARTFIFPINASDKAHVEASTSSGTTIKSFTLNDELVTGFPVDGGSSSFTSQDVFSTDYNTKSLVVEINVIFEENSSVIDNILGGLGEWIFGSFRCDINYDSSSIEKVEITDLDGNGLTYSQSTLGTSYGYEVENGEQYYLTVYPAAGKTLLDPTMSSNYFPDYVVFGVVKKTSTYTKYKFRFISDSFWCMETITLKAQ